MPKHRDIKISEKMTQDFVDEVGDQKEQARAEITTFANQAGWRRITEVLDKKIEEYTKEILETESQGEELNRLRDRRDLCIWFKNLPDILKEALVIDENVVVIQPNQDPYNEPKKEEVDKP